MLYNIKTSLRLSNTEIIFMLHNLCYKKSYAIYHISTFQMLLGSWREFSGRPAGHNCRTVIISLASV